MQAPIIENKPGFSPTNRYTQTGLITGSIIGKRTIRYPSDIKNFCTKHAILLKDLYVTYDGQTKKLVLDNE